MPVRESIGITPLSGALGAEISGVDLSRPLDTADIETLVQAWNRYSVLVYRDQQITPDEFLSFSRCFGGLEIHVLDQYLHLDHPEILVVSNVLEKGRNIGIPDAGRYWHTDLSYMAAPSRGSILYAIEIPEADGMTVGNTLWTSTAAAYEALPKAMKRWLDGLSATYSLSSRFDKISADGDKDVALTTDQKKQVPDVVHPVVRTHPVTMRKCIFVNELHTSGIVGLPDDESRALLAVLQAHVIQPEFVYRHSWQPGDVVMWDNVPTQHLAMHDYALPQRRLLHRTTITGDRPY
jgi:taurine dioxygenase